jgi:GH24 family phage-related lysozyme (muramidase)
VQKAKYLAANKEADFKDDGVATVADGAEASATKKAKRVKQDVELVKKKAKSSPSSFGAAANVGIYSFTAGYGGETWYSPNKQMHLGIQVLTGSGERDAAKENNPDSGRPSEYIRMSIVEADLKMRYFITETFYLSPSFGYAAIKGDYGVKFKEASKTYPYKSSMVLANIGIGNLWTFSNGFAIGAEWFTLQMIATHSAKLTSREPNVKIGLDELSDDEKKAFEKDLMEAERKSIQFRLLTLTAGWQF